MKNSKKSKQRIQNQFGAFCTRVLKNETKYIRRELNNKTVKEKSFDDLSEKDLCELAVYDDCFNNEHYSRLERVTALGGCVRPARRVKVP